MAEVKPHIVKMTNGCWAWHGDLEHYGVVVMDGVNVRVHRWTYEQVNGPIPDGHHVHHDCHNPGCVNSEHLRCVTPFEHVRIHKGRNDADPTKNLLTAMLDADRVR